MTHSLLTIPNEILCLITEELRSAKDVGFLILTSRLFAARLTPVLSQYQGHFGPTHWAAAHGHGSLLQLILDNGGNPNIQCSLLRTPLHYAAIGGHGTATTILIDHGAHMQAKDHRGFSPLHNAVWNRRVVTTEILLSRGADVNVGDKHGITPLHLGVVQPSVINFAIVKLLLDYGADVMKTNRVGRTAWYYAPLRVKEYIEAVRREKM